MLDLMRDRRKEIGLTQKELADFVGCSESTISQYESGKRRPDYETLLKIAEVLHLSASEMLGDSNARPLSAIQRQMLDAIDGIPDDGVRALIDVARRMKRE